MLKAFLLALKRQHALRKVGVLSDVAGVAAALVDVVPGVVGAVICVNDVGGLAVRIPVAGSDTQALLAGQLEFATGSGPGLYSVQTGQVVLAGPDLAERWPTYAAVLTERTEVRAVCAVPLDIGHPSMPGALLLYLSDPVAVDRLTEVNLDDVVAVVAAAVTYAALTSLHASTSRLPAEMATTR